MKYFAYGSNMLESWLKRPSRTPTASYITTGILRGFMICFHKIGQDGSGKCNVLKTGNLNDIVYGVVYRIENDEVKSLDKAEGVQNGGYSRQEVNITTLDRSREETVECYLANPAFIDKKILPFSWYKALVIAGAIEHKLPEEYVCMLKEYPSIRDNELERESKAMSFINSL